MRTPFRAHYRPVHRLVCRRRENFGVALLFLIVVSVVPAIGWVWFFYRQDRYESEPLFLLIRTFVLGMIAVIPAIAWEQPFEAWFVEPPNVLAQLLAVFVVVGLGEELFKFFAVYVAVWRSRHLNEVMDGIVYAVTAALGFAAVENLLYTATFGLEVAPARALVASLAHASFSGVMGFHFGWARLYAAKPERSLLTGIALAGGLHGVYDYILVSGVATPLLAVLVIVVAYVYLSRKIQEAHRMSPFRHD